jgi:membrane fusion protein, multidrug efflux system
LRTVYQDESPPQVQELFMLMFSLSSAKPASAPKSASAADAPADEKHGDAKAVPGWRKYGVPILVLLLALAVLFTITHNWNSWEGGHLEQITDDAYVRGDLTPLSTKVTGIVSNVDVSDYQQVHKGDLLVQLEDKDYQAQAAQASEAVEAAKAAIENNHRQLELQDTHIQTAVAGIEEATAQIAAAQAGKDAVEANLVRARSERKRQEGLYETHSTTQQALEQAVAAEQSLASQYASSDADLTQARAALHSSELAAEAQRRQKIVLETQNLQLTADLRAKQAGLVAAQVSLGYTKVFAPSDGNVGERQVRPGQLVSPGTEVIPFIDSTRWVQANYKETQLTNVRVGDAAEIRIDEYPGQAIHGKVIEIAPASGSQFSLLPPDNATGNYTKVVQRIPVKIALDDTELSMRLRPGLSVIATVRTKR